MTGDGQQTGDFTGSVVPSGITIGPGEVASSTITVIPINGFTGNVSLSVTGTPAGATALFTPAVVNGGSGPSVLSISTSPTTPLGKYVLTLTGTSGSISHSTTLILSIASNADFTGTISPSSAAVVPGGRASFTATVIPLNGFNGNVTVTASGLPAGATATVTPATVMHGSGAASVVITTTASTPIGSYAITLTGTCGTLVHATNVTLNVNSTPGDFGASISPTSQTVSVSAGNFASYGITLFPINGFTGNVTLSASGVPAGATSAFNPGNVVTGGSGSATLVIHNNQHLGARHIHDRHHGQEWNHHPCSGRDTGGKSVRELQP